MLLSASVKGVAGDDKWGGKRGEKRDSGDADGLFDAENEAKTEGRCRSDFVVCVAQPDCALENHSEVMNGRFNTVSAT
ncbi:hypothetical protein ACVBEF_17645 [Glaciimonas sp. GG7]